MKTGGYSNSSARPLPDGSMLFRYKDVHRTVREGEALQTKADR